MKPEQFLFFFFEEGSLVAQEKFEGTSFEELLVTSDSLSSLLDFEIDAALSDQRPTQLN